MTEITTERLFARVAPPAARRERVRRRRISVRRLLVRCLVFLVLGAAVNVAVAIALGLFVDVSLGTTQTADSWTGRHQWTVTRWNRVGATYVLSVREGAANWSPGQAIGPPNTPTTGGDQVTAWASATTDAQEEWLLLEYAEAVVPKAVRVYETCSTGAVSKVSVFTLGGVEVEAWCGIDPSPPGQGLALSEIPLHTNIATRKVKVYIDSQRVPSWNEIDAVGLVGPDDKVHWAIGADASSTYASARGGASLAGVAPQDLAPAWGGLRSPGPDLAASRILHEERAIEARGWPMLALWGPVPDRRTRGSAGAGTMKSLTGAPMPGAGGGAMVSGFLVMNTSAPAPTPQQQALLVRPVWPGFLVNSAVFAVLLAGLHWALVVPRRFVREVSRMRRGCCVSCGYDLGFDFVPGCPECGWRRDAAASRHAL